MATQKTQTKNEKIVEQTDPNLESEVQQDTTPTSDSVTPPAIVAIALLLAAGVLFPEAENMKRGLLIMSAISAGIAIAIALGLKPTENYEQPDDIVTDPTWRSLSCNIFNSERNRTDRF